MIASSSTFYPHPGRVIRDLLPVRHGTEALVRLQQSSKGSCNLLVSGHNLWADCQLRTLVVAYIRSTAMPMQLSHQCRHCCRPWLPKITGNRVFDIRSRTGDDWSYPAQSLLWGLSDPRIAELCEMPRSFSVKLHSETQFSSCLGMAGGESPYPCPITPTLTSSSVHHSFH